MAYAIGWSTHALRDAKAMRKLRESQRSAILEAIESLRENPRHDGCVKLQGDQGYRIRAGDFRVIYDIKDEEPQSVLILSIGNRRDVYK